MLLNHRMLSKISSGNRLNADLVVADDDAKSFKCGVQLEGEPNVFEFENGARLVEMSLSYRVDCDSFTGGVGSFSKQETEYSVSLEDQTCTCPDFQTRVGQPKDHFSRWCKHLLVTMNSVDAFANSNKWHRAIANTGFGGPLAGFLLQFPGGSEVAVTAGESTDWLNVYSHTLRPGEKVAVASGPVEQFGWCIGENRWSYGEAPPNARAISAILKQIDSMDVVSK